MRSRASRTSPGGTAVDTFTLSGTGSISGTIAGVAGADTLVGNGVGNTWAVTASTSGTLTDASGANAYTGIVNLTGGAGAGQLSSSPTASLLAE